MSFKLDSTEGVLDQSPQSDVSVNVWPDRAKAVSHMPEIFRQGRSLSTPNGLRLGDRRKPVRRSGGLGD